MANERTDPHDSTDLSLKPMQMLPVKSIRERAKQIVINWIAGSIGHPYVSELRDNLDKLDGRSRVSMMLAEEVGKQAVADPITMERARERFLGEIYRRQANVEAVGLLALKNVSESDFDPNATDEVPTPDWMNSFTHFAEGASSDALRERLAKLLAGEIKSPGSVSRSTIRIVSEIEKDELDLFSELLRNRFKDSIYTPKEWTKGIHLLNSASAESLGLIIRGLTQNLTLNSEGSTNIIGDKYSLTVVGRPGTSINIDIYILTKLGKELSLLLDSQEEHDIMNKIADGIVKDNIKVIAKNIIIGKSDCLRISEQKIIWQDPELGNIYPIGF